MSETINLAVIGGSGLYKMPGLENTQKFDVSTPFGKPSSPIIVGELEGQRVAFLARHGIGHHIMPGEVNYQANIYALKKLGADRVVSVSAVGSLREDYAPGHIVIPDQIYDNTKGRNYSFFGDGLVVHISVADPFCPDLSVQVDKATRETDATVHTGGSMIVIEGPRFSTKIESNTFRSWGMDLIGMTASPEAFLAREAELCYSTMAHVTDYDVWHVSEAPVTVEMVIKTITKNAQVAQDSIRNLVRKLSAEHTCECHQALSSALITRKDIVPPATLKKVDLLIKKYYK